MDHGINSIEFILQMFAVSIFSFFVIHQIRLLCFKLDQSVS